MAATTEATVAPPLTLARELAAEHADRDLARILTELTVAAKALQRDVARAALAGRLGVAGSMNQTGDAQKKLDVYADELVVGALQASGLVCRVVSEEREHPQALDAEDGRFVAMIDPLDGSSNTDVNGGVGTVFALARHDGDPDAALRRAGAALEAAGYVLYGASCVLVLAIGGHARGYTLDPDLGEFVLSHARLRCPEEGPYYSANLANASEWDPGVRRFVRWAAECNLPDGKAHSLRYSGALVADVHRALVDGGIYLYPADQRHPDGKLRLLYECAPLALIVECAGGAASTGRERILDVAATDVHQRVPLAIGSRRDVERLDRFVSEG